MHAQGIDVITGPSRPRAVSPVQPCDEPRAPHRPGVFQRPSSYFVLIITLCLCSLLLAACQSGSRRHTHASDGWSVEVPDGWQTSAREAADSPMVLTREKPKQALMIWLSPPGDQPALAEDSRRYRWMASRCASSLGENVNKWSIRPPLVVEDVVMERRIRDSRSPYILSAASPYAEICLVVYSYDAHPSLSALRPQLSGVLSTLRLQDGSKPFASLPNKPEVIVEPPSEFASVYRADGDVITLPKDWLPEDVLLIGSPGGFVPDSHDHAELAIVHDVAESLRLPPMTFSWARRGNRSQDFTGFSVPIAKRIQGGRQGGTRSYATSVTLKRGVSVLRFERHLPSGGLMVDWYYLDKDVAFHAQSLAHDRKPIAGQEQAVAAVLSQLLSPR